MKFQIYRTSERNDIKNASKPCTNAYYEYDSWFIDINEIYELMSLKNEVGEIIISSSYNNVSGVENAIEIYDYYRE